MAPGMGARQMVQHFVSNEGEFSNEVLNEFKAVVREHTQGWIQSEWNILLQSLTREAWAVVVTKEDSDRQIFYAELTAYAERVRDGRLGV